jgi:VanZ family protein
LKAGALYLSNRDKSVVRWLARLAFAVGVVADFYLCVARPSTLPGVEVWDKLLHAGMYCSLSIAALIGFRGRLSPTWICLAVFALGGALELVQAVLPYRNCSFGDLIANGVGIALGLAFVHASEWLWSKRSQS